MEGLFGVLRTGMCPAAPPEVQAYPCSAWAYLVRMSVGPSAQAGQAAVFLLWALFLASALAAYRLGKWGLDRYWDWALRAQPADPRKAGLPDYLLSLRIVGGTPGALAIAARFTHPDLEALRAALNELCYPPGTRGESPADRQVQGLEKGRGLPLADPGPSLHDGKDEFLGHLAALAKRLYPETVRLERQPQAEPCDALEHNLRSFRASAPLYEKLRDLFAAAAAAGLRVEIIDLLDEGIPSVAVFDVANREFLVAYYWPGT